jgi:hypothetical protein
MKQTVGNACGTVGMAYLPLNIHGNLCWLDDSNTIWTYSLEHAMPLKILRSENISKLLSLSLGILHAIGNARSALGDEGENGCIRINSKSYLEGFYNATDKMNPEEIATYLGKKYTYIYIYTYIWIYAYTYMYIYICIYICMYLYMDTYKYIYMYIYTYISMFR